MKKIIFLIVLVCFLPKVYAQDFTPSFKENTPTVAVSISPFSFAINKAEIGLDLRIKERQWLTIAPILQFGNNNNNNNYYDYYDITNAINKGFGLKLNYRYFPLTRSSKNNSDGLGPFISGGISGMSTTYDYIGNSYVSYIDDYGVNGYILDGETPYTEVVSQFGMEVNIGYTLRWFDILFAEAYIGMGARYSDYEYDALKGVNLGKNTYDTGYTGYTLTGGLRLGIFLNKYKHR